MSMDLEYTWQRYGSDRKGGQLSFSLMITCKRWFFSEKVPFRLVDGTGQLPPKDGYIELEAGQSFRIDYDTYDWDWCDGDYIIIFDKKGREYDRQIFRMKTYAPGECPECHGSHQCAACNGTGRITDKMHMISTCPRCLGTGLCQTCYVPTRAIPSMNVPYGSSASTGIHPNVAGSRQRRIEMLRRQIFDLQQKIEQMEWEERTNQMRTAIHGKNPYGSFTTQNARIQLKYQYQTMLQNAINELEQLEREGL